MENHNHHGRDAAEQVVGELKKDFTIVGKQRVHSWYAWAIVGIVFGMALGIVYVANRSAQFEASQAAIQKKVITPKLSKLTTNDVIYIPAVSTTIGKGKFLHALIVTQNNKSLFANVEKLAKNATYYIRYSQEDVREVTYDKVVKALKAGDALVSLCGKKYAETTILTLRQNVSYSVELRLSNSADPTQSVPVIGAGEDCPSAFSKSLCNEHTCSFDDAGTKPGQCLITLGCWCHELPKKFDFGEKK